MLYYMAYIFWRDVLSLLFHYFSIIYAKCILNNLSKFDF